MAEPITCPHCRAILTDAEVQRMHQQYASAQRKVRAGGRNGGRPQKYPERAARRHSNAVLQVGPESERQIVPIEEI